MKVALIQPTTQGKGKIPVLPLGLLQVGTPASEKHDVEIFDCNLHSKRSIKRQLAKFDPQLVGFTSKTGSPLKDCISLSRYCQENLDCKVVWGGVHATLLAEQVIREDYVDIVVRGEGDFALTELLEKEDCEVEGIIYKKEDNTIAKNGKQRLIRDLGELPLINWDLIDLERYKLSWLENKDTLVLPTSRGCPFNCHFCYNRTFHNNKWRGYPLSLVKQNLDNLLARIDVDVLKLDYEDNFIGGDPQRALKISNLLSKRGLEWACQVRPDQLSPKILKQFKRRGCIYLFIGVESGSPRMISKLNKKIDLNRTLRVFKKAEDLNLRTVAAFMLDLPGETAHDLKQTEKFARKLNSLLAINFYQPYPRTRLYERLVSQGKFKPPETTERWAEYNPDHCHGFSEVSKLQLKRSFYRLHYLENSLNLLRRKDFPAIRFFSKNYIRLNKER